MKARPSQTHDAAALLVAALFMVAFAVVFMIGAINLMRQPPSALNAGLIGAFLVGARYLWPLAPELADPVRLHESLRARFGSTVAGLVLTPIGLCLFVGGGLSIGYVIASVLTIATTFLASLAVLAVIGGAVLTLYLVETRLIRRIGAR